MRFTKDIVQKILNQNNGFSGQTSYEGRNYREYNNYKIKDGEMFVDKSGKTSWSDSRFSDHDIPVDLDTKKKKKKKFFNRLNTKGIENWYSYNITNSYIKLKKRG